MDSLQERKILIYFYIKFKDIMILKVVKLQTAYVIAIIFSADYRKHNYTVYLYFKVTV